MANNRKTPKRVDPIGNAFRALSSASDTLSEVQNALASASSIFFDSSPINIQPQNLIYGNNTGIGGTWAGYNNFASTIPYYYDSGGYPKVDIVEDTMLINDGENPAREVPAWRVDVFVAGVPKENIKITMSEAVKFNESQYLPTLTINVEKTEERQTEQGSFFLKESKYSASSRVITLPLSADVHKTEKPILKDGVFSFKIGKTEVPPRSVFTTIELPID